MKSEHHILNLLTLSSILLSVGAACPGHKEANVLVRLCCPETSDEDSAAYPISIILMGKETNNSSQHKVKIGCPSDNNETKYEVFDFDG